MSESRSRRAAPRRPPGPRGLPGLGPLPDFLRRPFPSFGRWAREHGDVVFLDIPFMPLHLIYHPDAIERVLVTNRDNYRKDRFLRSKIDLFGDSSLIAEGERWRRHRSVIQPTFSRRRLASQVPAFATRARALVDGWRDGELRDLHADVVGFTLEATRHVIFGERPGLDPAEVAALIQAAAGHLERPVAMSRTLSRIPTPAVLRYREARARLDALIRAQIDAARREPEEGDDLLSGLVRGTTVRGERVELDDGALRDELMTLFLAGFETTALLISFAVDLLAEHPDEDDALAAEVAAAWPGEGPTSLEEVVAVPRLRRVLLETLRVRPPAYIIGRESLGPDELGGYDIPAGATVMMPQWAVHRDPRFWEDPERFLPERWTPELQRGVRAGAFFPFGGGPRVCVGREMALLEAEVALGTIVRAFRFRRGFEGPLDLRASIAARPRGGLPMRLAARGAT